MASSIRDSLSDPRVVRFQPRLTKQTDKSINYEHYFDHTAKYINYEHYFEMSEKSIN